LYNLNIFVRGGIIVDDSIKKANLALLEGDREEVLRLLSNKQPSNQVMWLRAHAAKDDEQRLALLRQISAGGHPVYGQLARNILDRERQFESDLSKPAEYKFWTRHPWQGRLKFLIKNKFWFLGGFIGLVVLIIGINIALYLMAQSQAATVTVATTKTASAQLTVQATPRPTPSVTPLSASARGSVNYTVGKLSLVRIEFPTNRLITFSNYGDDRVVATPAAGARFAAVQVEFTCLKPICDNPPEAELGVLFSDGSSKDYRSGVRPVLIEQPVMARISNNQSVQGWFVFEIPSKVTPTALRVITGDDSSPVLELTFPK
jgi:hypothetical protein